MELSYQKITWSGKGCNYRSVLELKNEKKRKEMKETEKKNKGTGKSVPPDQSTSGQIQMKKI